MKLLTNKQGEQLIENGRANAGRRQRKDFKPVVKLYCPWSAAIWLLTEIDPDNGSPGFGWLEVGEGFAELGSIDLSELASRRGPDNLRIERDPHFKATKKLSVYAREAGVRIIRR